MKMSCDKEAIIDRIHDAIDSGIHISLFMDVLELLEGQPQIVRCRDCKWFCQAFKSEGRCLKHDNDYHEPNWFCADGERENFCKPVSISATDYEGINCE